jgi:hypothetical protein
MERVLHEIRRSILDRLQHRICSMHWGYTYIERGVTGRIENERLKPFASFDICCAAAQQALDTNPARRLRCTQVINCRYNHDECLPEMQPVLKTIERRLPDDSCVAA